jgi:four helix bundle protein
VGRDTQRRSTGRAVDKPSPEAFIMRFEALELALTVITSLRKLLPTIRRSDPRLATQIRDAGSSIALNLGEGNRRQGRDRTHLWRIASGSAEEVRTALRVSLAWGYLGENAVAEALRRLDHLQAILWKLTR